MEEVGVPKIPGILTGSGRVAPTELNTAAVVTQEAEGLSVRISGSALTLRAKVPKLTKGTLETMAWHALNGCSISKV